MAKPIALLFAVLILPACGESREVNTAKAPKELPPPPPILTAAIPPTPAADDRALRRSYTGADIKLAACASLGEDGSIQAKGCSAGGLTFGPYIDVPANADVTFAFDVKSDEPLTIASDIVSQNKTLHAFVGPIAIVPGATRHLAYKVRFPERAASVEARIGIEAKKPISFKLNNLVIAVQ
jgi:hypothetical protein